MIRVVRVKSKGLGREFAEADEGPPLSLDRGEGLLANSMSRKRGKFHNDCEKPTRVRLQRAALDRGLSLYALGALFASGAAALYLNASTIRTRRPA